MIGSVAGDKSAIYHLSDNVLKAIPVSNEVNNPRNKDISLN